MGTYFNTWQRKLGCVLLAAALVLASVWGQCSKSVLAVEFVVGEQVHRMAASAIGWSWFARDLAENPIKNRLAVTFAHPPRIKTPASILPYWKAKLRQSQWQDDIREQTATGWSIPHGLVVLPLALLSACLLLWRRPKGHPE